MFNDIYKIGVERVARPTALMFIYSISKLLAFQVSRTNNFVTPHTQLSQLLLYEQEKILRKI